MPTSWKEYYRLNPCVPVDYPTVAAALTVATEGGSSLHGRLVEQRRSVRVWLRPQKHYLREAMVVQSVNDAVVTIETMEVPQCGIPEPKEDVSTCEDMGSKSPAKRALKKAAKMRQRLSCRSVSVVDMAAMEEGAAEDSSNSNDDESGGSSHPLGPESARASVILRTRKHNEPIVRVRQGTIKFVNVSLIHNSTGIDIWNGNAAIQIQPHLGPDDRPAPTLQRPRAILEKVEVTSKSGRGIVNIDGGLASIKQCYVHDCAATGIYVGGPGSDAVIEASDVVRNGNGNRSRRGIARGHSGIYLEQGNAQVRDCNISRNSLTGISVVSVSNAVLNLEASDLVANGSVQLEMPPTGSVARRNSLTRNNNVATRGIARTRSGLVMEEEAAGNATPLLA